MKVRCQAVGAVVKNSKGHYLVLYRITNPPGLAFPAGHVENGERPDEALKRELYEETGIKVKHLTLKLDAVFKGRCNRKALKHRWYIYQVPAFSGWPRRREKKKHAFVKFMSAKRIIEYVNNNDIDPVWTDIFRKLKIINGNGRNHKH